MIHNKFKKLVNKNNIELLLKKQEINVLKHRLIIKEHENESLRGQLYYLVEMFKKHIGV